jgi:hypothetical protein
MPHHVNILFLRASVTAAGAPAARSMRRPSEFLKATPRVNVDRTATVSSGWRPIDFVKNIFNGNNKEHDLPPCPWPLARQIRY